MRLLPHDPDGTCANGRRHGSVPELWTDGHLPHACTCRSKDSAMVSSTDGSASTCTSMASCTAIPYDGRDARGRHALIESQRWTESERGPATEARSWPAAPQHHTQCSCRSAPLGFVSVITSSHAFHGFSRYACRAFGNWTAQSIALDSRCSCSAEHGTHGRLGGHARNAPHLARFVTPRQRCVPLPRLFGHSTA